ncbi:MAG TPA: NADP-dependent oxidoreductase [Ignavibacteria bacterium]|jgi:NADPH:quinone reductase-like Zn-dependent oxidoreductase
MKAAQINEYGRTTVIKIADTNKPSPSEGEVLIEAYGSSINPIDTAICKGRLNNVYALKFPIRLGSDIAGIISELGSGVTNLSIGDKVYGNASVIAGGSGAFGEFALASSKLLAGMPKNLSFTQAATIVLSGLSAQQALSEHIKLKARQRILIHGGAGGIGTAAIQLAKHIGALVTATATGVGIEHAKLLGADITIDYKTEEFDEMISGYDAVLDTIGKDTYKRSFKVLKQGGIIVSMVEKPDKGLMEKYKVTAILQLTKTTTEALNALRNLIENKILLTFIEETYSLNFIIEAFETKETGQVRGKIAIEIRT